MDNSKQARLLELFFRGLRGEALSVKEMAAEYGVSTKSVSRDLNDLKAFFADHRELVGNAELEYSYQTRAYHLRLEEFLSSQELYAITEVLLGARAFSKMEVLNLMEKLKKLTVPADRKRIDALLRKELYHYHEVHHDCDSVQQTLWQLVSCIEGRKEITLSYHKMSREFVERRVRPVSILFSEYYFYLIAYPADAHRNVPHYYRVDRISKIVEHRGHFDLPAGADFDEGLFRAQNQFMFPGRLQTIRFLFYGPSVQAVLDRLPTAKVIGKQEGGYLIEATVYGDGIKMYLLSQGAWVKVLSPQPFVEEMRRELQALGRHYGLETQSENKSF